MSIKKMLSAIIAAAVMLTSSATLVGNVSGEIADSAPYSQSRIADSDSSDSGESESASSDDSNSSDSGESDSASSDDSNSSDSGESDSAGSDDGNTSDSGDGDSTSSDDSNSSDSGDGDSTSSDDGNSSDSGDGDSTNSDDGNSSNSDEESEFKIITDTSWLYAVQYVPYSMFLKTTYSEQSDKTVTFKLTDGSLPEGVALNENTGVIYGAPLTYNTFNFTVTAVCGEETAEHEFNFSVQQNYNRYVNAKTDYDYEVLTYVGKQYETDSLLITTTTAAEDALISSNTYRLTKEEQKSDQEFKSKGGFEEFVKLWLNGEVLTRNTDYIAEEGSTKITIKSQTLQNLAEDSLNTIVAEFRVGQEDVDKSLWEMKITAQNVFIGLNGTKEAEKTPSESTPSDPVVPSRPSITQPAPPNSEKPSEEPKELMLSPKVPEGVDGEMAVIIGSITVQAPAGVLPNGTELVVTPDLNVLTDKGVALDFTFILDGGKIQPDGSVIVQVNIPENYKGMTLYVYHIEDGKYVLVESTVSGDKITFTASHFSTYVISDKQLDSNGNEIIAETPDIPDSSDNPVTGVSASAVWMVISSAALVFILKSAKKKV